MRMCDRCETLKQSFAFVVLFGCNYDLCPDCAIELNKWLTKEIGDLK